MAPYSGGIFLVFLLCAFPNVPADEARRSNSTAHRELLISSFQESLQIVSLQNSSRQSAPSAAALTSRFHRQTDPETQEVSRAAEVFHTTVQILKKKHKRNVRASEILSLEDAEMIAELSQCPLIHPATCQRSIHSMYRSISGLCNNRQNPLWGAANTPLVRWLPAEYEDGEGEPKGWNRGRLHNGFQLPPPRDVSRKIVTSSSQREHDVYSQLLVEWGQFIDHDISFTPQSPAGANCSTSCENVHPCFPIQMEEESGEEECMPFRRSTPACSTPACPSSVGCHIEQALQRQQMNGITSFIDASLVYGSTPEAARHLRDLAGLNGKLAVNECFQDPKGRPYLPFTAARPSACLQSPQTGMRVECFSAGDGRVSEGLPLISLHTLLLREHNRVAEALRSINAHWKPGTVYQESRKVVGALLQIITMRDYVPKVIGPDYFGAFLGAYGGYDPTTDPSASNVFATAAFRFGHATIPPILMRLNEKFQEHECLHLKLHSSFFSPWRIVTQGGIEPVLRGMFGTAAEVVRADKLLVEEVTERIVVLNTPLHLDLASLNLQRGRDHALPGYNAWRSFCGLKTIKTLDDLKEVIGNRSVAEKVLDLYGHPDNIDVWLGGLLEHFLPGARTGPLFACLIGWQMKVLRDGDRFWWEAEGQFSQQQKAELLKASLSRVICDNSDITEVPPDPFLFNKYPSGYVDCCNMPSINLEAWREQQKGER